MATNFTDLTAALQALTADYQVKEAMYARLFDTQDISNNFTYVPNVTNGMITPTFKLTPSLKPYTNTFSGGSDETWGAKQLDVYASKIEHTIEQQKYLKYWRSIGWLDQNFDPANGDINELARKILGNLIEVNKEKIRNDVLWNGERNNAGTTAAASFTGFKKIIADAITAGTLPSGQVVATSAITSSNVIDKIKAVVDAQDLVYRGKADNQVLVSQSVFDWAVTKQEALNPYFKPELVFAEGKRKPVGMYLTGSYSDVLIKPEISMAGSSRIICANQSFLQFGSNSNSFAGWEFAVEKVDWNIKIYAYMEMGAGIYELGEGAITVNNQA